MDNYAELVRKWEEIYGGFDVDTNYNHLAVKGLDKESGWIRGEIVKTVKAIRVPVHRVLLPGEHNSTKEAYAKFLGISAKNITTAGLHKHVDFRWDFEKKPPNIGHFDLIISQAILEHLIDPYNHVKDLYAVLKPGGNMILHTVIPGFPYHRHPVDCMRFFPDWFELIAQRLKLDIAEKYLGEGRIMYRYIKNQKPKKNMLKRIIGLINSTRK